MRLVVGLLTRFLITVLISSFIIYIDLEITRLLQAAITLTIKSFILTICLKVDQKIRGHVFCSFLSLVLRKELDMRMEARGESIEWLQIKQDLKRLQEVFQLVATFVRSGYKTAQEVKIDLLFFFGTSQKISGFDDELYGFGECTGYNSPILQN
jgi:hypothetical protein